MCTITWLPLSSGRFLLTQNRDESPQRPAAIFPVKEVRGGKELLFPQDPLGGGSWIATDQQRRLVCLMNGAFDQHTPQPPYRLSRGQVLLDAGAASSPDDFFSTYNLANIEPFTLFFFEKGEKMQILELKWDGKKKYVRTYNPAKAHIWSAPQLYSAEEQKQRESWFRSWLASVPVFSAAEALHFHCTAGDGNPEHSLLLNRGEDVKTVSISQAELSSSRIKLCLEPVKELEKRSMKCG